MRWFRARARWFAAVTTAALVSLTCVTSAAHGFECHEDECGSIVVPHDAASHAVTAGSTAAAGGPLHCVLCHWTRSTRPAPEPALLLARPAAEAVCAQINVGATLSPAHAGQPSLRSPPLA
jgi:hypothetical protein